MAAAYEIVVKARNDTQAGFNSVKRDTDSLVKRMKSAFGEESGLGNLGKVLAGTGAVAGFTLLGNLLTNATAKGIELRDAIKAGSDSAGEMADQFLRSLPVLGSIISAGQNIRELITGENAETQTILKQATAMNAVFAARQRTMEATAAVTKDWAKTLRGLQEDGILGALQGSLAGQLTTAGIRSRDLKEGIIAKAETDKARVLAGTIEVTGPDGKVSQVSARQRLKQLDDQLSPLQALSKQYDAAYSNPNTRRRVAPELAQQIADLEAQRRAVAGVIDAQDREVVNIDAAKGAALNQITKNLLGQMGRDLSSFGGQMWEGFAKEADKAADAQATRTKAQAEQVAMRRGAWQSLIGFASNAASGASSWIDSLRQGMTGNGKSLAGMPTYFSDAIESGGTGIGAALRAQTVGRKQSPASEDEQKNTNKLLDDAVKRLTDMLGIVSRVLREMQNVNVLGGK